MDSKLFYKAISEFYDLIDIVYFRDYDNSPRKVVFESIEKDLHRYFERYGLKVVSEVHCDYSRVLKLKRSEY